MRVTPYPGWKIRIDGPILYHEPLVWWKRWPLQLMGPLIIWWRLRCKGRISI